MDPAKIETGTKTEDRRPTAVQSSAPQSQPKADQPRAEAVSRQEKVELAPRLPAERSPFAVGPGEYRGQEVEKVSEPTEKVETEKPAEPARGIPQAIVKGPPQPQRQSPTEIKPADKKKSNEEDEEGRGMFDQLKEDMDRVRKLLNPFNWW